MGDWGGLVVEGREEEEKEEDSDVSTGGPCGAIDPATGGICFGDTAITFDIFDIWGSDDDDTDGREQEDGGGEGEEDGTDDYWEFGFTTLFKITESVGEVAGVYDFV